jgi:hypothetical protein
MPIKVTNFVWAHELYANTKPEKITTNKPIANDVIYLSEDRSIMVKKSQYTLDMCNVQEDINTP